MNALSEILDAEHALTLLKTRKLVEKNLLAVAKRGDLSIEEALQVWKLLNERIHVARPKAVKASNWSRN